MNSEDNLIFLIIVALVVYWLIPSSSDSDIQEKTVYYTYCTDFKHNPSSCPKGNNVQIGKHRFKIFLKEQMVISHLAWTSKLNSCAVFDKDNWWCGDSNYTQSMNDGDYWDSSYAAGSLDKKDENSPIPKYQQIPRFVYYIRYVMNFLR